MRLNIALIIMLGLIGLSSACERAEKVAQTMSAKATAYGKMSSLIVVADDDVWESAVGDSIRFYFQAPYILLPQPEPIYDVRQFTPEDLAADQLKKEQHSYLIVGNLSDEDSPTAQMIRKTMGEERLEEAKASPSFNSSVVLNPWASNQTVIYQFGWTDQELADHIVDNFAAMSERYREGVLEKVKAKTYPIGQNKKGEAIIEDKFDVKVDLPKSYEVGVDVDDFLWARNETDFISSNLLFYSVDYEDEAQLSKEGIKSIRDSITRHYIASTTPDSYMQVNDVDLPMFTTVKTINDNYSLEARGIWNIVNDHMGGPFLSVLIHNPNKKKLLFVDAFVYAPGKKKRDLMVQLEYILSTLRY